MKTLLRIGWAAALLATLCGCSTIYYGTLEKFGQEKRDILVKRVGKARDRRMALERLQALIDPDSPKKTLGTLHG